MVALVLTCAALLGTVIRGRAWPPLSRYVVQGPSMEPAYRHGDRLLVNRLAYLRADPRPGEVVILRDPDDPGRFLLKRVVTVPDGSQLPPRWVYLLGDNSRESRDSRHFGAVPASLVVGRAWRKY